MKLEAFFYFEKQVENDFNSNVLIENLSKFDALNIKTPKCTSSTIETPKELKTIESKPVAIQEKKVGNEIKNDIGDWLDDLITD